jgi:hypothetical protein
MKYKCVRDGATPHKGRTLRFKKGENDVEAGSLDHVGACERVQKKVVKKKSVKKK